MPTKRRSDVFDFAQTDYEKKIAALRENYIKQKAEKDKKQNSNTEKLRWQRVKKSIPKLTSKIPTMSHEELMGMFQKCIKKMAGRRPSEISPAVLGLHKAIVDEWERRTDLLVAGDGYFEWPTTDAPNGDGNLSAKTWHEVGMLSTFGYHVGTTHNVSEGERRYLLDQIFNCPLPPLNNAPYMKGWSTPKSKLRLKKIAETIAALTRNAKRRRNDRFQVACDDWETDLLYLYQRYYVGQFRFGWPQT